MLYAQIKEKFEILNIRVDLKMELEIFPFAKKSFYEYIYYLKILRFIGYKIFTPIIFDLMFNRI